MKIDIDLNKLSLEELKIIISLVDRQEDKAEEVAKIVPPLRYPEEKWTTPKKSKKRKSSPRYSKEYWNNKMAAIHADVEAGMARTTAIKKHIGYAANSTSEKYKKYVRKISKTDKRGIVLRRLNEIAATYINQGYSRKVAFDEAGKQYKAEKRAESKGMIRDHPKVPLTVDEERVRLANKQSGSTATQTQFNVPKAELRPVTPVDIGQKAAFPELSTIQPKYLPLLKTMLNNVINTDTKGIGYYLEGVMLEMPLDEYHKFLYEFMINSTKIADYFGVINKFKVITQGKERRIIYEKRQKE